MISFSKAQQLPACQVLYLYRNRSERFGDYWSILYFVLGDMGQ